MSKTYGLVTFTVLNGESGTYHYVPFHLPSDHSPFDLDFKIASAMLDYFGIDNADKHHHVEDTYRKAKAGEPLNECEQDEMDDLVESTLDEGFYVHNNERFLSLHGADLVTEQEYEVLKKFLG